MGQNHSDAPAQAGTTPAAASAITHFDIGTPKVADAPKIGESTSDGISSASLGAGDPQTDLNSVKSLNSAAKGSERQLGLPDVELHDPSSEATETGGSPGGATKTDTADTDSTSGTKTDTAGTDSTSDTKADTAGTDSTSDTKNGGADNAPTVVLEVGEQAPDAPITSDGKTRSPNPRDASPLSRLGHSSMVGNAVSAGDINSSSAHNPHEQNKIQQAAKLIGGSSGISSLGSSAASSVIKAAEDAAHSPHHHRQRPRRHR